MHLNIRDKRVERKNASKDIKRVLDILNFLQLLTLKDAELILKLISHYSKYSEFLREGKNVKFPFVKNNKKNYEKITLKRVFL